MGDQGIYILGGAAALIISIALIYNLTRWVFSIKEQLRNQKQQVKLLSKIAEKLGVPAADIETISKVEDAN